MPTPTSPPVGFGSTGVTTIVWGTDGLAQFVGEPAASGSAASFAGNGGFYIIKDFRQQLKKDMDYGENGSGVQVRRTAIIHGQTWNITVEDDTQMTPPVYGTLVTCYNLLSKTTATGLAVPGVGNGTPAIAAHTLWSAVVVDSEYTAAPKRPGERVLVLESLTFVDAAGTA